MDYSITFARHFSRLLWLLLHEGGNVDEQKAALRAMVTTSKDGALTLATQDFRLAVNGAPLPDALTGVQDLAAQLIGHAIGEVRIQQHANAADLLGFARVLAAEPIPGDGGKAVLGKLQTLGVKTLSVTIRTSGPIAEKPRPLEPGAPPPPVFAPLRPSNGSHVAESPSASSRREHTSVSGREQGRAVAREHGSATRRENGTAPGREHGSASVRERSSVRERGSAPIRERASAQPRARTSGGVREHASLSSRPERPSGAMPFGDAAGPTQAAGATTAAPIGPGVLSDENSGRYLVFAAVQASRGADESFAKLDATKSVSIATRLLDELVTLVENAGRDARADVVADVMAGIAVREAATTPADMRRAYNMALRRLSKPTLLRQVAMLLPRKREKTDDYLLVLAHAGEDGAEALIEQLTAAQSLSDRRIFFDGLLKMQAGIPALMHMLGDARWYVVRNAADLLGELQATEADQSLTEAVRHDDERVRRAAAAALAKLGTPRAHQALREALRDTSPQVRMQAAIGLSQHKAARQGVTLSRALDTEADEEVQLAILASLGRIATPEALQKLIAAAEPEGRLFRKKSTAYRIAAVQALGEVKTKETIAALQALAKDKDKEVRELAARLLSDA